MANPTGPNPLYIDLIILKICRKLELKDLLSCRLVCQKWYEQTTPIVQKYGPRILIKTSTALEKLLPRIDRMDGGCCLLDVGDSLSVLCAKLILNIEDTYGEYQELIDKCAPTVRYLEVTGGPNRQATELTLRNWMLKMPELETLKINCPVLYEATGIFSAENSSARLDSLRELSLRKVGGYGRLTAEFFDDFFGRSQNLTTLSIDVNKVFEDHFDENPEDPDCQRVANLNVDVILKSLEDHGNLEQLKTMRFTRLTNAHLTSLIRLSGLGLHLSSFELTENWTSYVIGDDVDDAEFVNPVRLLEFISTQKTSLSRLVFSPMYIHEVRRVGNHLTGMCALEHLELFVRKGHFLGFPALLPGERPPPPSFCFPEMFPNLTKLSLRGCGMSCFRMEFFADTHPIIPCTTLKYLRLPPGNFTKTERVARNLSQLFPNITSLDVRLPTNQFLHGIWKFWPELTDLKVVCVHKPTGVPKPKFWFQKPRGNQEKPKFGYIKPSKKRSNPKMHPKLLNYHMELTEWNPIIRFDRGTRRRRHCQYLDHGFTGIDSKICADIEESGWTSDLRAVDIIQQSKLKPSIADLKNLKRLKLEFVSGMKRGCTWKAKLVSDLFIHAALMQMPQLEEVVIAEKLLNMTFECSIDGHTSDLSLGAVQDLRKCLSSTKIQIGSKWKETYDGMTDNRLINIRDIADFDKKHYTILDPLPMCGIEKGTPPLWKKCIRNHLQRQKFRKMCTSRQFSYDESSSFLRKPCVSFDYDGIFSSSSSYSDAPSNSGSSSSSNS